jgi:tetratricopeptide (TPR) repeat protein
LADLLKSEQRNDQAIAAYQDAQQLLRKLVAAHPAVLQHRVELAGTCINLGNLRNRLNQPALAFTAFDEAIRSFPEATRSKLDAGARSHLEKAFTGRGLAHEAQGDLKGMASDFEMAASLAPSGRARILRLMCVSSLADGKQLDRAVAVAEPLVGDAGLEGPPAFDLANLYIRAAIAAKADHQKPEKDRAALAEQRIQHGLWLLQRAFGAGFFGDPSHRNKLQSSPFVPLLATNAAFRKLVEAVEKGPPAKPQAPAK